MENIRKFPRKSCAETTFFATSTMVFEGMIKNISQEGAYIESLLALPVGQSVTVAVPSPRRKKKDIKIEGRVVWINQEGFGNSY